MYMVDINIFAKSLKKKKKKKKTGDPDTNNKNIEWGYRNRFWHWKMCHDDYEKEEKSNNWRNITAKLGKYQTTWREGKLQILGKNRSWHHQTNGDETKNNNQQKNTSLLACFGSLYLA